MASGFEITVAQEAFEFVKELHEIVSELDDLLGRLLMAVDAADKVIDKAKALLPPEEEG